MIPDLKDFIARHGEPGAQVLVENLERYAGIPCAAGASLEERWKKLMDKSKPVKQSTEI
jgi:hypothetical protein